MRTCAIATLLTVSAAVAALIGSPTLAQQPPPRKAPAAPPAAQPAAEPAAQPSQPPKPPKPPKPPGEAVPPKMAKPDAWERLIYIPYRNLKSVFDKHPSTVFLPYMEYLRLWEAAGGAARAAKGPPVPGVITEASYVATVDENLVRITAELKIQVLGKAWSEIPVSFGQAAIGKVSSADGRVILRGTGAGRYALLFPEPGAQTVTLELTTRIRTSADGHSFAFTCPTVGMTTFELSIPRPAQVVDLTPQLVALPVKAAAGQTKVRARLGATPKITALWYPRVGQRPDMDLLTSVSNYQHISIRDGLVHSDAYLHHEVLRGELTQLRIAVPKGHTILDVTSTQAKIKGWKAVDEENRQVVTVEFIGAVRGKFVLEVHTERKAAEENVVFAVSGVDTAGIEKSTIDDPGMKVHGIHSLDAVRESGQVVVTKGPDLTLTVQPPSGLVRIEPNEVLASIRRPGGQSYKYYSPRFDLRVSYEPVQPRVTAAQTTRLVFRDEELRLESKLTYTVERAGVFEWKLKLPEGLELDDVDGDARKEHDFDEATRILTVSLAQRRQGTLNLTIKAHQPFDGDSVDPVSTDLPVIVPLGVVRESGKVLVYAPNTYEVITDDARLQGIQQDRTDRGARSIGRALLTSAWQYTSYPTSDTPRTLVLPVTTTRRPTTLAATVATTATARNQLVEVSSLVVFDVQYAGKDTFQIQVPEAVAEEVQIVLVSAPGGVQTQGATRKDDPADGWVTCTRTMQREVTGKVVFQVTWDLKEKKDPAGAAGDGASIVSHKVTVQPPRPLDLDNDNISGEIAVMKDRTLEVTTAPEEGDEGLKLIDVRELVLLQALRDRGSAAYEYHQPNVALEITTRQYKEEQVVETMISRALVEIVINKDGQTGFRCRYRLKSSERQRLRVDLPEGCSTPEVYVDQRKVPAEQFQEEGASGKKWNGYSYSINVAGTKSDTEFFLTLQFEQNLEQFFDSWLGSTESIALPAVGGRRGDGAVGKSIDVVTQELRVGIRIPEEYKMVGVPDGFVSPPPADWQLNNWIDRTNRTGDLTYFPTQGRRFVYSRLGGSDQIELTWWKSWSMTAGVSIPVFLIGCVLLWTPWTNRVGVLLVGSFVTTLWSQADADSVTQVLLAARYGFGFVLAVWLLASVVGFQADRVPIPWRRRRVEPDVDSPTEASDPTEPSDASEESEVEDTPEGKSDTYITDDQEESEESDESDEGDADEKGDAS